MNLTIYGNSVSGNCHKLRLLCEQLGREYRWVETDNTRGQTHTPEFLARNPNGKVPVIELEDGRILTESNAILCWLAEGTEYFGGDAWQRAQTLSWMFFEQYSHEPYIAVCRFLMVYLGKSASDLDPDKVKRGHAALTRMEEQLSTSRFLVGEAFTVADIALLAYTRVAYEGDFDLAGYGAVRRWIGDCENALALS